MRTFNKIALLSVILISSCGTVQKESAQQQTEQQRPEKPNVILLLTDDLGWQDVKAYDIDEPSPFETPNIDALAGKGAMF
ncbi:hypothetical protein [Pseudoalteromonas sp. A601]|uniref:hypothetical protein n=1 Tax=Pseudoalteromonas sp. A601 TaxID=1967839 RepID=UPI001C3DA5D8|nr:hypothetical protein [Pseudoalteromonas sp. A601]